MTATVTLELVGLFGAIGGLAAIGMFIFFVRDRRVVLLRAEVNDEQRRREQLDRENSELRRTRDLMAAELVDEKKKTDMTTVASGLERTLMILDRVATQNLEILDKLAAMNGGIDHATEALKSSTTAIEFLAKQIVLNDPDFKRPPSTRTRRSDRTK